MNDSILEPTGFEDILSPEEQPTPDTEYPTPTPHPAGDWQLPFPC